MRAALFVLALAASACAQGLTIDTVLGWEDTMPLHPHAVITNHSNEPAMDVSCYWTIDDGTPNGYNDSLVHFDVPGRTSETLDLVGWVPRPGRDSISLLIVLMSGDTADTWFKKILPRFLDAAVAGILAPVDTLDSGVVIWPASQIANPGTIVAHFVLQQKIGDYVYEGSVTLFPGESRDVIASESLLSMPGVWTARALAVLTGDMDPTNNVVTDTFWVRPLPGVEETPSAELRTSNVAPTVLRSLPAGSLVFDAMGRRVVNPKPGVYFVRERSAVSGERSAVGVRKVILHR